VDVASEDSRSGTGAPYTAADELRANSTLSPAEYRGPVLGLIFLSYAEHRFEQIRPDIEAKATARRPVTADAVVKTIAGFLNTDGGTLLIGVDNAGAVLGLGHDYNRVQPKNGDGFVNWLTTGLINALGHVPVTHTRVRIVVHDGHEICRVDVAKNRVPGSARTSKDGRAFFAVQQLDACRARQRGRRLRRRPLADLI